jgi:hypothetical protein
MVEHIVGVALGNVRHKSAPLRRATVTLIGPRFAALPQFQIFQVLLSCIHDPDDRVRTESLTALLEGAGAITDAMAAQLLPQIVIALRDESAEVRLKALGLLRYFRKFKLTLAIV